jgi:hypothetical protein
MIIATAMCEVFVGYFKFEVEHEERIWQSKKYRKTA